MDQVRLAVILHADVVASTALVRQDESLAHSRIQRAFRAIADAVRAFGGIVQEVRGDALLAEFAKPSDAVACAVAAQLANTEYNATIGDCLTPELRFGIALGEVVVADETMTGSGVVLAQRLEQLADANGVCISAAVREAVPDRLPFDYTSLGEQSVKGFEEPVRAFAVTLRPGARLAVPQHAPPSTRARRYGLAALGVAAIVGAVLAVWHLTPSPPPQHARLTSSTPSSAGTDTTTARARDHRTIAVLPFANMSNDPEQDYFSDGLTEDIITDLARVSGLFVIARNSTFVYKGQAVNVSRVGRELGVRYVLEGSLRKAGNRIRVTAQLIDVESGMHVWANRYDRALSDVFALQDELTRTIVSALSVNLTPEEATALSERDQVGIDAYDLLLRGNEVMGLFTPAGMTEARSIYNKVINLNPRYARAHANIAWTHAQEALFGWTDDVPESIRLGWAAAERARLLNDRLPQLHLTLAALHGAALEWEDAARAARKTIALEPSYADAEAMSAVAFTFLGELETARSAIERAKRLNPHYSAVYMWIEGRILYLLGRYEQAARLLERAADRNPDFDQPHILLAASYAQLGRIEEAKWEAEQLLLLDPDFTIESDIEVRGFRDERLLERYTEGLRKAGLPRSASH